MDNFNFNCAWLEWKMVNNIVKFIAKILSFCSAVHIYIVANNWYYYVAWFQSIRIFYLNSKKDQHRTNYYAGFRGLS